MIFEEKPFSCYILLTDQIREILNIIAYTKKYLQFDWPRGVQYWLYLYSVFNICTLKKKLRQEKKFRSGKIEMYSLKTN